MMRKQLIVLTLVLMMLLALCCGAAQADGTQQIMLGGDVLTKGAHFVMAGTNWDVLRNSTNTDDTAGRLAISSDVKNRTGKKSWLQQMKYIDSFYESEFSAGEKEAVMYDYLFSLQAHCKGIDTRKTPNFLAAVWQPL